ncbi:MAG: ATP-binding cassette domain-containing protein [Actinomycetota bacterium]|nr:ATP-binding cassette domain-containing protein [Actinomycetota bacterium]
MLSDEKITKSLNLKKELCSCPLVNTNEALKSLESGQVLEVITDHPPAAKELIPRFCEFQHCPVSVVEDAGLWRILIKKEMGPSLPETTELRLELKDISKGFTSTDSKLDVLRGLNIAVRPGEFICLVGPSGCGKSTLLNLIAGLETPESGDICVDGRPIKGPGSDRVVIFQERALFPWLNVLKNVEFGLKIKRVDKKERRERARDLLRMVHLSRFENSYIHELSGGMKQRVALARALAMEPKILLMDEPFTALDAQTRHLLHLELQEIWLATGKTIIFVTHNVREAVSLADRVIIMSARPARIKKEYQIDLTRPRRDGDRVVSQVTEQIMTELKSEIDKVAREELYGEA